MKIAISAESTIDLTKDLLHDFDIHVVPFTVTLGDVTAFDGQIETRYIIDYVNRTNVLPKTSAVNQFQYEEHFTKILEEYDAIIHLSLSSEISCAYNNACLASEKFENVYIIDTRSLSTGIALQAIYASKLAKKEYDPKQIVKMVEKRRASDQTSFIIMRLDYLYKGGRCNAIKFLSATLLKIRPQIIVRDGKMLPTKKYRGDMSNSILKYVDDVLKEYNTPDLEEVFITSTTATPEQIESVRQKLIERGFKNIYITYAGATITSHCGENCLGILYMNDGDANGEYQEQYQGL